VCGELAGSFGEHLCGDDVVGLPRVAELPRAVLGVAAGYPVHLVGPDPRLVLAIEERDVALAQQFEPALRDEAVLDDQEAVARERVDLLGCKRLDQLYACSMSLTSSSVMVARIAPCFSSE
jgi:hypothetical protein